MMRCLLKRLQALPKSYISLVAATHLLPHRTSVVLQHTLPISFHGVSQVSCFTLSRNLSIVSDSISPIAAVTHFSPISHPPSDSLHENDPISNGEALSQSLDQCESAAPAQSSDQGTTFGPAALDYFKVVRICEILNAQPWGPETVELLEKLDMPFSSHIVTRALTATTSPNTALEFFNWLTRRGFEQDARTYAAVINSLGTAGCLDDMKGIADEMRKVDLTLDSALYDKLIRWCVRSGDAAGANDFFARMNQEGISLTVSIYTSMFDLYAREGRYEEEVTLYLQMVEEGILPSSRTLTVFISHLLGVGKLDSAYTVFTTLSGLKIKPSMLAYAYLMAAYAKVGNIEMVRRLGKEMRVSYNRPGGIFCIALESLQREGKVEASEIFADEVWPELSTNDRRLKFQDPGKFSRAKETEEDSLLEDLLQVSASFKEADNAQECQDSTVPAANKTQVSLSEITRLLESEGFQTLEQVDVGWTDDAVYKMLGKLNNCNLAWEFFQWLKARVGFKHDIYNEIHMLRMLAQDKKFAALQSLLSEMQAQSDGVPLKTFNTLIKDIGFVKNSKAALWVFSRMKESNLQPTEETFKSLVHALARDNKTDKAFELCALMQDLGIKLDLETYTAVIHSFGLARKSDEAWSAYQKMLASGLRPDAHTYTVLLNIMNTVGDTGFAMKLYKEMNDNGVAPTAVALGIMARLWRKSGDLIQAPKLEMQMKFLSSKTREDSLQRIYEILLENLVEQEKSPSLLF